MGGAPRPESVGKQRSFTNWDVLRGCWKHQNNSGGWLACGLLGERERGGDAILGVAGRQERHQWIVLSANGNLYVGSWYNKAKLNSEHASTPSDLIICYSLPFVGGEEDDGISAVWRKKKEGEFLTGKWDPFYPGRKSLTRQQPLWAG
jgi:hypothetical protein